MTKEKPYKATSLSGAQAEVRRLRRQRKEILALLDQFVVESMALAKLAAKGPAFFNPLDAWAAEKVRDAILLKMGMAPDGTFLKTGVSDDDESGAGRRSAACGDG